MIFEISDEQIKYLDRAKSVLSHANNIALELINLFLSSRDSVFGVAGYTVADAQKLLDAMDAISPGSVIKSFQMHAALGEFLLTTNPAGVAGINLDSPVPYEIEMTENGPRIKLVGNKYPTEESTDEV